MSNIFTNKENFRDVLLNDNCLYELSKVELKNYYQKIGIFKYLYSHGPDTHQKICESIDVSFPTFSFLINDLIKKGCIDKQPKISTDGGRKMNYYELNPYLLFVFNIWIKPDSVRLSIVDNTHHMCFSQTFPEVSFNSSNKVDALFKLIQLFIVESEIHPSMLIGISITGNDLRFSKIRGHSFSLFTRKDLKFLQRSLKEEFNKPIYIMDVSKGSSIAELNFGKALNRKDVLVITMDWGIDLGIILNGKLQTGTSGYAGEFAHMPFIEDGELCHCGKKGCLETVASGYAIVENTKKGLLTGQTSILNSMIGKDLNELEPGMVVEAANKGDQFAIKILSNIGLHLGKGLAILIQIFNPELIVLQGKISKANKFITTPIEQSINKYCMIHHREGLSIAPSSLEENTIVLGSTVNVFNSFFQSSDMNQINKRFESI